MDHDPNDPLIGEGGLNDIGRQAIEDYAPDRLDDWDRIQPVCSYAGRLSTPGKSGYRRSNHHILVTGEYYGSDPEIAAVIIHEFEHIIMRDAGVPRSPKGSPGRACEEAQVQCDTLRRLIKKKGSPGNEICYGDVHWIIECPPCHMIDWVYGLLLELFTYCVPGGLLLNDAALEAMIEDCAGDGILASSVRDFVLDCDL